MPGPHPQGLNSDHLHTASKGKGLEVTPNTTRANLYSTMLGSAEFTHPPTEFVHPQEAQDISVLLLDSYHKECLLYVSNKCNWLDSESYENVKDVRS